VGVFRDCPNFWSTPYYLLNGLSCDLQIWQVYSQSPYEQKPMKNLGEKGPWAYPGIDCPIFEYPFRLLPKSMTLDDLERPERRSYRIKKFCGARQKNFNEDRAILSAAKRRPTILVPRNIRYMRISAGVPQRGAPNTINVISASKLSPNIFEKKQLILYL